MSRLVVACDIDGVLADFVKGFTATACGSVNHAIPVTDTLHQPKWNGFPGMTDDEINKTWRIVDQDKHFWSLLRPMPTPKEMNELRLLSENVDLYFTTARRGLNVMDQTRQWLREYTNIAEPNIIITDRKGEAAAALKANFLIDDKAGNAVYAEYHNKPRLKSYVIDRPYNQFDAEVIGSGVIRVNTVEHFINDVWERV